MKKKIRETLISITNKNIKYSLIKIKQQNCIQPNSKRENVITESSLSRNFLHTDRQFK